MVAPVERPCLLELEEVELAGRPAQASAGQPDPEWGAQHDLE